MGTSVASAPGAAASARASRTAVLVVLWWATAYFVLSLLGRATVIGGTGLAMVAPAAGMSVLWLGTAPRRSWWLIAPAVGALSVAANLLTGTTWSLLPVAFATNVVQPVVCALLLRRLAPQLVGGGGRAPLRTLGDLGALVAGAATAGAAGTAIASINLLVLVSGSTGVDLIAWWGRNTAGIIGTAALGMLLAPGAGYGGLRPAITLGRHLRSAVRRTTPARAVEFGALVGATVALYVVDFTYYNDLPVAFPVLIATLYAAARFGPLLTHVHSLVVDLLVVVLTLNGIGPFVQADADQLRAMGGQLFVLVTMLIGLALALSRQHAGDLVQDAAVARAQADHRAEELAAVVDAMKEGVALVDETGNVELRNGASRTLLGVEADVLPLLHSDAYELLDADGHALPDDALAITRILVGEDAVTQDVVARPRDGGPERTLWLRLTRIRAHGVDGTTRAVLVFDDVTEQRAHVRDLEHFAGVVAHDLSNPVGVIDGWSELLLGDLEGGPENGPEDGGAVDVAGAIHKVRRIRQASAGMRDLIDDLLAFTTSGRAGTGRVVVELEPIVRELVRLRADAVVAERAPRLVLGDLPPVLADPGQMRQLLDNLIGNAVKYVRPGAVPEVHVESVVLPDGWVQLSVADRGIGIPPAERGRVFEAFHRAAHTHAYAGTGLGLSICERIVRRHGGHIAVEDNGPLPGSRFVLTLPGPEAAAS